MTAGNPRVSFVTIGARDVTALREFYGRVGFVDLHPDIPDFASFQAGGVILALYELPKLLAEADPSATEPPAEGFGGIALSHNVDTKDDVDPTYDQWVDAGATPVHPPVDRDPVPVRSGYVADPEGNRWEIAWNAELTFDANGAVTGFGGAA
jgi:catechol 2,3-dioxygenase-like lactoylglutathione lyase family enzyme